MLGQVKKLLYNAAVRRPPPTRARVAVTPSIEAGPEAGLEEQPTSGRGHPPNTNEREALGKVTVPSCQWVPLPPTNLPLLLLFSSLQWFPLP